MVGNYLRWLASRDYSEISRHQALCALKFTFTHVLKREMGNIEAPVPIRRRTQKECLTRGEVRAIIRAMRGLPRLQAALLYGTGLRIMELCRLRVKDLDFGNAQIIVRGGKGNKDRLVPLPIKLVDPLLSHLALRKAQHRCDLEEGGGRAPLPTRLERKYRGYATDFRWQFVFASAVERDGVRWHATPRVLQEAFAAACNSIGLLKRAVPHDLRHAFATHLHDAGMEIRAVQDLMGHTHLETTEIYTHRSRLPADTPSPIDIPDAVIGAPIFTPSRRSLTSAPVAALPSA
jgi:integrase